MEKGSFFGGGAGSPAKRCTFFLSFGASNIEGCNSKFSGSDGIF